MKKDVTFSFVRFDSTLCMYYVNHDFNLYGSKIIVETVMLGLNPYWNIPHFFPANLNVLNFE